jgi:hypothetical protein
MYHKSNFRNQHSEFFTMFAPAALLLLLAVLPAAFMLPVPQEGEVINK